MRLPALLAGLLLSASIALPAVAAPKNEVIKRNSPTWAQCYQVSLDRGMDHEYEEWREFLDDCMARKIPLYQPNASVGPGRPFESRDLSED